MFELYAGLSSCGVMEIVVFVLVLVLVLVLENLSRNHG
jgi:hypothetical protein